MGRCILEDPGARWSSRSRRRRVALCDDLCTGAVHNPSQFRASPTASRRWRRVSRSGAGIETVAGAVDVARGIRPQGRHRARHPGGSRRQRRSDSPMHGDLTSPGNSTKAARMAGGMHRLTEESFAR
jgi:hypothetical protein